MNGFRAAAEEAGRLLIERGWTLSTAESVTAGAIAASLAGVDARASGCSAA